MDRNGKQASAGVVPVRLVPAGQSCQPSSASAASDPPTPPRMAASLAVYAVCPWRACPRSGARPSSPAPRRACQLGSGSNVMSDGRLTQGGGHKGRRFISGTCPPAILHWPAHHSKSGSPSPAPPLSATLTARPPVLGHLHRCHEKILQVGRWMGRGALRARREDRPQCAGANHAGRRTQGSRQGGQGRDARRGLGGVPGRWGKGVRALRWLAEEGRRHSFEPSSSCPMSLSFEPSRSRHYPALPASQRTRLPPSQPSPLQRPRYISSLHACILHLSSSSSSSCTLTQAAPPHS